MPWDWIGYYFIGCMAMVIAIVIVLGSGYLVRAVWRRWRVRRAERRVRDVHAERKRWNAEQGRRDGYVGEVSAAEFADGLLYEPGTGPDIVITRPEPTYEQGMREKGYRIRNGGWVYMGDES